jgi:hypothetical protein
VLGRAGIVAPRRPDADHTERHMFRQPPFASADDPQNAGLCLQNVQVLISPVLVRDPGTAAVLREAAIRVQY